MLANLPMSTDAFLSMFMGEGATRQPDPVKAAQAGMKTHLPRRFYKKAHVLAKDGHYHIALDGRTARTPARNQLAVGSLPLASAIAEEWDAQGQEINPARMPLTRLINAALDGVARESQAVRDEIVRYAGSDLLCYRAEQPGSLVALQTETWDPILGWARERLGARMQLAAGIVHLAQDNESLEAVARAVARIEAPVPLAALSTVTSLTGSALLALALAHGHADPDAIWNAAHLDENWQAEIWGRDDEAEARLSTRRLDYDAAAFVLTLHHS